MSPTNYAMPDLDDPASWVDWANQWPTMQALNMVCASVDGERGEFGLEVVEFPPNPNGSVNGGFVSLAVDQVLGIMSTFSSPAGFVTATATLNISYHLPAVLPLRFQAVVLPGGHRTKFIEVTVLDPDGRRCATTLGTMVARRIGPAPSG